MLKISSISWLMLGCYMAFSLAGCGCDCDDPDNSTPNALGKTLFNAFKEGDQETFMRFFVVPSDVDSLWNGKAPKAGEDQKAYDDIKEAFGKDYEQAQDEFHRVRDFIASSNGLMWEECSFEEAKFSTDGEFHGVDLVRVRAHFDCRGRKMVLEFDTNIDISGGWKTSNLPFLDRPF